LTPLTGCLARNVTSQPHSGFIFVLWFSGFATESDLETYFTSDQSNKVSLCGIVFNLSSIDPSGSSLVGNDVIRYKIRLRSEGYIGSYVNPSDAKNAWQTNKMYAKQLRPKPQGDEFGGNSSQGEFISQSGRQGFHLPVALIKVLRYSEVVDLLAL
jgi:hypothetical protein